MTCTRPPRGRLGEIQTHRPPACARSPSPALLSLPLSTALLASSPLQSFRPTHPRSWSLYLARWDLVKHHAVFWPQGKGSYCPYHDSRRERPVQGGAAGPSGAPWTWCQPSPLLQSPSAPSPPCSIRPCRFTGCFFAQSCPESQNEKKVQKSPKSLLLLAWSTDQQ